MSELSPDSSRPTGRPLLIKIIAAAVIVIAVGAGVFFFLPPDPYSLRRSDWKTFVSRFVGAEGRVIDTGNGDVSHTEGQGYGMLLAVAFSDRKTFDRMWSWTQTHMKRPEDAFFSWKWTPADGGKIADPNTASDGDLLIAWALLRAFEKWGDLNYQRGAGMLLAEFQAKAIVDTYLGKQMIPGQIGFTRENGVILNPSYSIFPAYNELKRTFPSPAWQALTDGGLKLVANAGFGKWKLSANWVLVGEDELSLAPGKPTDFGYDAIRVPLHIAWADPKSPLLEPFAAFWDSLPTGFAVPATVNLVNNQFGPHSALPGMLAVRTITLAAAKGETITVLDIPQVDSEEPYYSASLKLLVCLAITEAFLPEKR